jgi:hypothetical protein
MVRKVSAEVASGALFSADGVAVAVAVGATVGVPVGGGVVAVGTTVGVLLGGGVVAVAAGVAVLARVGVGLVATVGLPQLVSIIIRVSRLTCQECVRRGAMVPPYFLKHPV